MESDRNCALFFITDTQPEPVLGFNEICNVIDEVVDLVRQINLEVDTDDICNC